MIGAGGGGIAERNYIQPQMFEPNLLHALYVVAHEPLHPLFKHLNHRDLEESLVTALSLSILQSFPEVEEWKGDTAFLRTPIQEYIADHTIKLQYFRLVGEKLHALYSRSERQGIPWRLQDENEFLALIRNDYIIYADSPFAVKESQNINNAWISALYPYTFALVVADFFRQKSIQPLQIIKSKSMRDLWIPRLRDFLIQPPIRTINGEELWQSVRQEFLAQPGKRSMI
jgi:hypothetical protein